MHKKTGAYIFIPDKAATNGERTLQISAKSPEQISRCVFELEKIEQQGFFLKMKDENVFNDLLLDDPQAAAYYEKFSMFIPGET